MLALYYELMKSKVGFRDLVQNYKKGAKDASLTEHELAFLRTNHLFRYGNSTTRSECKATLNDLGRGDKWTLEECDDFGDPCNDWRIMAEDASKQLNNKTGAEDLAGGFSVLDSVRVRDSNLPKSIYFLAGEAGEVRAIRQSGGSGEEALVEFSNNWDQATGQKHPLKALHAHEKADVPATVRRTFHIPTAALRRDLDSERTHRCKKSRGSTHSIASLHLGFLDAGWCNGKLVFSHVSPHDYVEGQMRAPLGAQTFPPRAKDFANRMRTAEREGSGETCVRITYRMLPQLPVLLNELNVYAKGGSLADVAAASAGPDMSKFQPASYVSKDQVPGFSLKHPMHSYFVGSAGDVPNLVYLQAGAWDRAMGCLLRRDFVHNHKEVALRLADAAPGAALVFGTLPTGPAYPADPAEEMARLVAQETKPMMKDKVVLCLKYTPGPEPLGTTAEFATRAALLKSPLPEPRSITAYDTASPEEKAEKQAAQAAAELEGAHLAAKVARSIKESENNPLGPHNRTAKDIWILDRAVTFDALPKALRLEGDGDIRNVNFRRLHPAMIANVWDASRLVTGLLSTPAFMRAHGGHLHHHGRAHGTVHSRQPPSRALSSAGAAELSESSSHCFCSSRMQVANPTSCAPTTVLRAPGSPLPRPPKGPQASSFVTPAVSLDPWPLGYPKKGRLAHWAEPCDYTAVSGR